MIIEYYPDTDKLYIALKQGDASDSHEIQADIVADFDKHGVIIGFEIEHASRHADLTSLELTSLPFKGHAVTEI